MDIKGNPAFEFEIDWNRQRRANLKKVSKLTIGNNLCLTCGNLLWEPGNDSDLNLLQKSGFIWVPQLIVIGKRVVFIVAHMVKNPNWPEANQLAIYKGVWEVDSGLPRTSPAFRLGGGQ